MFCGVMDIMEIYERVRNLHEDHDFKQQQIADYLYITQSTYSNYESGDVNIPVDAFIKLAEYYTDSD